jgi:hypothetical protein
MHSTPNRRRIVLAGLASVLVAAGLTTSTLAAAQPSYHEPAPEQAIETVLAPSDRSGSLTSAQRRVIREATSRYRDLDVAIADGYLSTDVCAAEPELGGMGYHYVNPALAADFVIDPTRPEALLYAPGRNGQLRLVAVEYVMDDADGDLSTDDDRPSLFGHPFDGPMEGHELGQPVHYDIHAWVWKHNPAGELAQFNPTVRCPAES